MHEPAAATFMGLNLSSGAAGGYQDEAYSLKSERSVSQNSATPRNTTSAIRIPRSSLTSGIRSRGGDVERDAGRERERVGHRRTRSCSCRSRRPASPPPGSKAAVSAPRLPRPEASAIEATVKPSGILCRTTAKKISRPERHRDQEAGGDRDAVEEGVDREPDQGGDADRGVHHHLVVHLLAEVEVGRHGVLEEMDEEVAGQDQAAARGPRAPATPAASAGRSRPA